MYPLSTNPSPSTFTSAPRPTSTFKPIPSQQLTENQNRIFTSKFTTLWTENTCRLNYHFRHTISTYISTAICTLTTTTPEPYTHTSPKPHKPQDIQHSPVKTNVNPPTQLPISGEEQQRVPKSTNGSQVKHSKQQLRQQDERLCFYCNQLGHLKRNCPEIPYCSKCRTRGHTPDRCTSKPQ